MFKAIRRFFCGPTPTEAYANGAKCVDETLAKAFPEDKEFEAQRLYNMSSGGFNETEAQYAFDRGVQARLDHLGYKSNH